MSRRMLYLLILVLFAGCISPQQTTNDFHSAATSRSADLQLSVFITAQAVDELLSLPAGRREALSILRANGINKVYLEVYRSGLVVPIDLLQEASSFFKENGFEVAGAIATVPGENFGRRQEARYNWLNFQNQKTQDDLRAVMAAAAPIFDTFIIDDFLCSADTSAQSKQAKEDRTWSQYRMDLLLDVCQSVFITPAKEVNPDIHMIIKYPQWYDRFHLFGYDVARQPALFDGVWVGTETRNMYTQRFGFVQPYEGFVNYRWLGTLSGDKLGGAWFDHIECSDQDFIDQAYQSVLAGARELTLFNYFNFTQGHPGHHLLRMEFDHLADLAQAIAQNPVYGVSGYKPANSEAGGDLYIMDFIGMFGIPLVPDSKYPEQANVIFLPTQASGDPDILPKVKRSLEAGATIIVTSGFLIHAKNGEELSRMAGIVHPKGDTPLRADSVQDGVSRFRIETGLNMESTLELETAEALLVAISSGVRIPFLCRNPEKNLFVLNSHTYSQKDFDAVGEVLLCPRQLGLMDLPEGWANLMREAFIQPLGLSMQAPTRVSMQPFGKHEIMIQNYNSEPIVVKVGVDPKAEFVDALTRQTLPKAGSFLTIEMPARSRVWVRPERSAAPPGNY